MATGRVGDGGIFPRPRPCHRPGYGDGFRPRPRPRRGSVPLRGPNEFYIKIEIFTSKIRNFDYTPPKFMELCGNFKNIIDNMK